MKKVKLVLPANPYDISQGGLKFPKPGDPPPAPAPAVKVKPEKKPKAKNNPVLVAKLRELNARWLEKVNEDPSLLLPCAKYDVSRALPASASARHAALLVAA